MNEQQQQQQVQPQPYVTQLPTNGMAVAALVLGIITMLCSFIPFLNFIAFITGVLGIIFGAVGINQVKKNPDRTKG
ncbi:MAG TPA: DUF4190 domain-containing protein, partial [Bacilli bacterium]|nr:DUF4190 domain-containing protein [Bacilli bacterium]